MVLESLLNPFVLKKKPWEMFFAGFVHAIIALFLAYFVFPQQAGLVMVFFVILASLPTLYVTIKREEELDLGAKSEWRILREHAKVLTFLTLLFLGIMLAWVIAFVVLPEMYTNILFGIQKDVVYHVDDGVRKNIIQVTGNLVKSDIFFGIMLNNLKVLLFCVIISFLYGTGGLFVLTWNASVVATAMGSLIKSKLAYVASLVGFSSMAGYFTATTFSFFRYMTHGILEIVAYFIAGLAGGIISVALIRHSLGEEKVYRDALYLLLISFVVLLVAALVEVYVTPVLFPY